jgi:DNA repair protein SbcC/Rad50
MIPIRLTLRNFLSYGEASEPLDFTGLHVACLTGSNGGGKSALLDGITWALWGQARAAVDDLVRLGQSSMQVEFDFAFDGAEYRVIRKRTRGRVGQSDLQFQVKGTDDSFRALTEQGVRATQERITQTLRMDYETFINSAFLLQGRADEFARKGAAERKRILAEILGLSVYEELVEAAKAKAREAEATRERLEGEIGRAEAEVAREPEYLAGIERSRGELDQIRAALEGSAEEHRQLVARKGDLEAKRQRHADLSRRLRQAETEMTSLRNQLAQVEQKLIAARSLLARVEEIRGNFERLQFARKRLGELGAATAALRRLEAERARASEELLHARNELHTKMQVLRSELQQQLAKEEHLPKIRADIADLGAQERTMEEITGRLHRAQEEVEETIRRQAEAAGQRERLAQTLQETQERFLMLKGASARCPVCGDELSEEKRRSLGLHVKEEKKKLEVDLEAAAAAERAEQGRLAVLRRQIEQDERKLKTLRLTTDRLAQARQKEFDIVEALKELPACREQVAHLEAQLAHEGYGAPIRERLAALAAQIDSLGYREEEHQAIQEEVNRLVVYEREQLNLERAQETREADERQAADLTEMLRAREQAVAEDRVAAAALEAELKCEAEIAGLLCQAETTLERLRTDQNRVTQELGVYTDKRDCCRLLREELGLRRTERDQALKDRTAYEELAKIFGRNGIQALIIENAIPEIEEEANRILARMSDNGMRVTFRTQRDTKTAGVAETLEIDISDSAGTRKYELFSGGEAFRANFAIRIALSKLLARRAGARLQTLVIDEGFGSQDTEGRDRLVEAIDSIRDDFEKILVVTHLDELKEFFPVRIEVTKGEAGSQIVVMS